MNRIVKLIKNFFTADPIAIGAQKFTSEEIVVIMNRTSTHPIEYSPLAKIAGEIFMKNRR